MSGPLEVVVGDRDDRADPGRFIHLITDYTIGVFIVLGHLLVSGLREGRERSRLGRASPGYLE